MARTPTGLPARPLPRGGLLLPSGNEKPIDPGAAAVLVGFADAEIEHYQARLKAARELKLAVRPSAEVMRALARAAGVSTSTVYRDARRLRARGVIADLLPRRMGYPLGRSRLHPRQEAIINELLRSHYLSHARPPLTETTRRIGDACAAENLDRPSRAAVIRRLKALPARTITLKRQGSKAAEAATPRPGRLEVERPFDLWQADHTLADVIVVDPQGVPIGRAWLTVIIDVCTRLVVSYYVGLDPPSTLRIATAMDLAVSDKSVWLSARGLDYHWPVAGLPRLVHTDRAKEFTSKVFERALQNQGVRTYLRPPGRTRFGGHVERLIGTLMGRCRLLPGATYNSPIARGSYDSKASARLTVEELELFFAHEILGRYHNTVHSSLKMSPLQAWRTRTVGLPRDLPSDQLAFRLDLLPEAKRTIGRQGIQLHGEFYYSPELGEQFIAGLRTVRVKLNPRDLSRIWVEVPRRGYIEVPYRFARTGPAPTLWLLDAARRSRTPGEARGDAASVRLAVQRMEHLIDDEARTSTAAARKNERLRRDRRTPSPGKGMPIVGPTHLRAETVNDWDGVFGDD